MGYGFYHVGKDANTSQQRYNYLVNYPAISIFEKFGGGTTCESGDYGPYNTGMQPCSWNDCEIEPQFVSWFSCEVGKKYISKSYGDNQFDVRGTDTYQYMCLYECY